MLTVFIGQQGGGALTNYGKNKFSLELLAAVGSSNFVAVEYLYAELYA